MAVLGILIKELGFYKTFSRSSQTDVYEIESFDNHFNFSCWTDHKLNGFRNNLLVKRGKNSFLIYFENKRLVKKTGVEVIENPNLL